MYTYLESRGEVERERERERTVNSLSLSLSLSYTVSAGVTCKMGLRGEGKAQVGTYIRNTRFTETGILEDMHMVSGTGCVSMCETGEKAVSGG